MKKGVWLGLILVFALIVLSAACSQTANNEHSGMNQNEMNHNAMNHNSMPVNSNMPMNSNHMNQMQSDANAARAPFDLQFIDTMTVHHEGAVRMAQILLKNSQNDELKKFARNIIDAQTEESQRMKDW